jgi:L-lactate dehydrogenase complex protein LldG
MGSARDRILADLTQALGGAAAERRQAAERWLENSPLHPRPAVAGSLVEHFIERLKHASGTFTSIPSLDHLGEEVIDYIRQHDLPMCLVIAADPPLDRLTWPKGLLVERRNGRPDDALGLCLAFAGVAETGSLVLVSGQSSPTTLNFLTDHHIVVLYRDRLLRHIEDAWVQLRTAYPEWPRTVNFITGPSRTADIEQTLQLGAHGPRWLHVVLIERFESAYMKNSECLS